MIPTFTIFLGNAKTLFLKVVDACSGNPFDLTNCSEIDVALPNQDGSITHLLFSEGNVFVTAPGALGQISAPISALISAALNLGEFQPVDVTFTISAQVFTVRFKDALSVFEV